MKIKWTIFLKWCHSNRVDFRVPPIMSIDEFLLYVFQDRKFQPGTLDGYTSGTTNHIDNSVNNVSENESLARPWIVFTETDLRVGLASPLGTCL